MHFNDITCEEMGQTRFKISGNNKNRSSRLHAYSGRNVSKNSKLDYVQDRH